MFRRTFGCGSLIFVAISTLAIISLVVYFAFNTYISPYLNNAQIQEIYSIYTELSKPVNETELVSNPPQAGDYLQAKNKLEQGGIHIFNEHDDIDPALLEESNFVPTGNIVLTDRELAAIINEFIKNPLNLEKVGVSSEDIGGLNTQVLEVSIDTEDGVDVILSFIVKLDMKDIKEKLAFFGMFLPNYLYIQNQSTLQLIEGEYQLISGNITVNNMSQQKNNRMLEILVEALKSGNSSLTVQDLHQATGRIILEGIQAASSTFNTSITFGDGIITLEPNIID